MCLRYLMGMGHIALYALRWGIACFLVCCFVCVENAFVTALMGTSKYEVVKCSHF